MALQRSVVCVFVKVQMSEKAEIIAKERDGFMKEKKKRLRRNWGFRGRK